MKAGSGDVMVVKDDIASADASPNLSDLRSRELHVTRGSGMHRTSPDAGVRIQLSRSKTARTRILTLYTIANQGSGIWTRTPYDVR